MKPDHSSDEPVFQQVASSVRQAVASGVYGPGESIPSIRSQAVKLRINPNTVKRAYEELQREGVLEFRPGLGLFVTARAVELSRTRAAEDVRAMLERGVRAGLHASLGKREIDGAYAAAFEMAARSVRGKEAGDAES
jgi:GntR family transcriptional regulator